MIDLNDVRPLGLEPVRHDLDEIVGRLRDTAEHWVPRHFPNGRRNGDEWRLANIGGDAPRKNGSCDIALKGPHAGDWIDFDTGEGGGPLSTLEHARARDWPHGPGAVRLCRRDRRHRTGTNRGARPAEGRRRVRIRDRAGDAQQGERPPRDRDRH